MNKTCLLVLTRRDSQYSSSGVRQPGMFCRFALLLPAILALLVSGGFQASAVSYRIWNDSFMPANPSVADSPVTVGVKFQSQVDGFITGIRYYKASGTSNNVGSLWTRGGVVLASVAFTNETAGGWQEQAFASPVAISANTTYVAAYHTPSGLYAATAPYFGVGNYVSAPLVALGDGVDGGNGVYSYGATASFPANTFNSANYWVDVVFEPVVNPCANDTNPPVILQCASGQTRTANASGQAAVPDFTGGVVAQDDCPGALSVTQSPVAGTLLGLGQHLVTLTVRDASSNSAPCTATFTVEPPSTASGVIGDFVWKDLNQNGIQDAGEPGLPGVRVSLFDCLTRSLIDTKVTDAAGRYRFESNRTNSLYLKFDPLPDYAFSPRDLGGNDARDSDVDPASGQTTCFALNCQNPVSSGCIQTNWDVGMFFRAGLGVRSPGYWKNHLSVWPATVTVGCKTYTPTQAQAYMQGGKDKTITVFRSLVSAKLNVLNSNASYCIADTIAAADRWMCSHPPGSGVAGSSAAWKQAAPLHERLEAYNNGGLCASTGEGRLSVGKGGGNDRPGHLRLRISGEPGAICYLQQSSDMTRWTTIATVTNAFGITEYLAQVQANRPQSFYRLVSISDELWAEPFQKSSGVFMELRNERRVSLFPVVYRGDLIIRGNNNVIKGSANGGTVVAGDLVVYGNANQVLGLKVLGKVILKGNANALRDVDTGRGVENTGNANQLKP